MPIHFACQRCGKALFAQEQYAGRLVKCPACQTDNTIPAASAPHGGFATPTEPLLSAAPPPADRDLQGDAALIDMEKGPEPAAQQPTLPAAQVPQSSGGADAGATPAAQPAVETTATQAVEATKRCPMCAETIKAAARKCRFCGAVLDEELRVEEAAQRERHVMENLLADAERSTHTWRVLAMVAATITASWLALLTTAVWAKAPGTLIAFNLLLIVGLIWNTRQMPRGPSSVFLAAACAVILCMPLDSLLELAVMDAEILKELQRQDPQHYAKVTLDDVNRAMSFLFTAVGFVVSIPVWIAMLKVAYLQRLRNAVTSRNGRDGQR